MSATHRSARPKGYMHWSPSPDVARIVEQTLGILDEYGSYGPMTVRQIFYRLVGNYGYDKTERAYKRLAEYLVKARRSQMVPFDAIRDDGGTTAGGDYGFEDVDSFLEDLANYGQAYRLHRTLGQPYHVEVWCEAEGMVPMLGQIVRPWGVSVTGTGGFSSLTVTHGLARRIADRYDELGKATVLLHVGDYDPSGESIFRSMCQDIGGFVGPMTCEPVHPDNGFVEGVFVPRRVALTETQVTLYDLPTAPPKQSDSRSRNWIGETTQAEAMPPDLLAEVVGDAVKGYWDEDARAAVIERESAERKLIGSRVTDAVNAIREDLS